MPYQDFLQKDHGYVILASTGAFVLHMWLSFKVGAARKKYGVKYPAMYSDKEETFNCIQRAHQNTLEGIPFYLSLLFTAGIRHPCAASAAGAVYLIGRVIYASGYSSGKPEKRIPGAIISMAGGLLPLLLCSISTAAGAWGCW